MFIDKVAPFYTEEERKESKLLLDRVGELLREANKFTIKSAEERAAGDDPTADELALMADVCMRDCDDASDQLSELANAALKRYADFFRVGDDLDDPLEEDERRVMWRTGTRNTGNIPAILADIREIVAATSKEEYFAHQARITEFYAFTIANPPTADSSAAQKKYYKYAKQRVVRNWANCCVYLLIRIRSQSAVLSYYREPDTEAVKIVEAAADRWYKRPKSSAAVPTPPRELKHEPRPEYSLFSAANSPVTNAVLEILGAGKKDINNLPARKKATRSATTVKVSESGKRRLIEYSSSGRGGREYSFSIEIQDIGKLTGSNKAVKKIFILALSKLKQQAYSEGKLVRNYVSWTAQELVELGMYSNTFNAIRGVEEATRPLLGVIVSGSFHAGKDESPLANSFDIGVLFHRLKCENGVFKLFLNEGLNWGKIAKYNASVPRAYFGLPNKAADLLYWIFLQARKNKKDIKEKGFVTLKFRTIQQQLGLPSERGNPHAARDIKDAIEAAIVDIEDATKADSAAGLFRVTPFYNEDDTITDFLDKGFLKIELSGEYAKRCIEISDKQEKIIQQNQQRKARIEEKAAAAAATVKAKHIAAKEAAKEAAEEAVKDAAEG